MKGRGMTKAKKWKIGIIAFLGLVATVLIAIGEGRLLWGWGTFCLTI